MGYTHYWSVQRSHPDYAAAWSRILDDTARIIDAVRGTGVVIAGPDGQQEPILDPADGIAFNGDATTGLDYETFFLPPPAPVAGYAWAFCKTDRCPYDLAVAAVLLRCRLLLPEVFLIASDGSWDTEWLRGVLPGVPDPGYGIGARHLVRDLFGTVPDTSPLHPTALPHS
jgi:hypothetical protein